jgi:fatty-acyl-CoA synthase
LNPATVIGSAPAPQPRLCLADHVSAVARRSPHAPAVLFGELRWTYAELDRRVNSLATDLLKHGVRVGDRIATLSTPRPEFLLMFLAVGKIGGIWMGLNPRYRALELDWLLSNARPTILAMLTTLDTGLIESLRRTAAALPACTMVEFGGERSVAGFAALRHDATADLDSAPLADIASPDAAALLVYTSGSTGRPKGALISHYGLTFGSLVQASEWGVARPSMVCNLPINHVGSVADICAVMLVQGGTIVFQERFDPALMFDAIERERVSVWGGVPSMFQLMADHPRFATADLSSVELALWGGAAMSRSLIDRLLGRGLRLKTAYGMTETSCHVTFTATHAAASELEQTVGRPTPYTPCRIVDAAGQHCGVGVTGELQVFGRQNFVGYLDQPEATAAAFTADRWLKSGDLAAWTATGDIRLVGRLREVIKSGGYSVYPREVEMVIESHPCIQSCAVVGAPHPLFQEVGVAFVVAKPGTALLAEELEAFLRDRLANFRVPKKIVALEELPTLPIGKIDKSALRVLALDLFKMSSSREFP